jgi:hypothetical protein
VFVTSPLSSRSTPVDSCWQHTPSSHAHNSSRTIGYLPSEILNLSCIHVIKQGVDGEIPSLCVLLGRAKLLEFTSAQPQLSGLNSPDNSTVLTIVGIRECPAYVSDRKFTKSTSWPRIFTVAVSKCLLWSGLLAIVAILDVECPDFDK